MKRRVLLRLKNASDVGRIHRGLTLEWSEQELEERVIVALERFGEVEVRRPDPRPPIVALTRRPRLIVLC